MQTRDIKLFHKVTIKYFLHFNLSALICRSCNEFTVNMRYVAWFSSLPVGENCSNWFDVYVDQY